MRWTIFEETRMPASEDGHRFDFDTDVCALCGMTRTMYEDRGTPACTRNKQADPESHPEVTYRTKPRPD
jgi:hypothetical protein